MADRLLRMDVTRGGNILVNSEREIVTGFAVVSKGITHDKRGEIDDAALDAVVELGNKSKMGIKSRFGHPNMSSTALGTFLGRVKNFRRDGDIVRADLYLDKTAHETPSGDLAQYVLSLARSDPAAFGSSMVIYWDAEERKDKNGKAMTGEDGNALPPLIRIKKLFAADIVDDPAANNGFFSESVRPSAEMTTFLDNFLALPEAVDKAIHFLERYQRNKPKGVNIMELTFEAVKAEHTDIFNAIRNEGIAEGANKERERAVSIVRKAEAFKDMGSLALEAVEKGLTYEQAVIGFQEKQLASLQNASVTPVGPDAEETGKQTHFDRAKAYKDERGCTMTEALRATAEKRK